MHPIIKENWQSLTEELREMVVDRLLDYLSMSGVCPVSTKTPCEYRNEDEFCTNRDTACRCWMGAATWNVLKDLEEQEDTCSQTDSTPE